MVLPAPKLVPRIDSEFRGLIAPLTPDERRQLEANLATEGCRDALVTWRGILLDGHNRLEICTRLSIPFTTCEVDLPNRDAAKLWIEENQMGRRNLSSDQRAAIAYRILQRRVALSKKQRARKGGLSGGSGRPKNSLVAYASTKQLGPRLRERAASELGVSEKRIRAVTEIARFDGSMLEEIVAGSLTIKIAQIQMRTQVRKSRMQAALKTSPKGSGIYSGDFSLLEQLVPDNSAALFLCDPPYDQDGFHVYGKLAELAQAKLKPGRFCIAYAGAMYLPQIIAMMGEHLDYYWLCAVRHSGGRPRVWSKKIQNGFKPVVIFAKRPAPAKPSHEWFSDLVDGTRDKDHHEWGQGVSECEYFINRFSLPGELVVDPFCGGGTVPVACQAANRRCIATEVEPGVAAAARARMAAYRKARRTG